MVNIEIDGIPLKVDSSKMIIQVADEAGIDVPRFCYHKKLSIAANCRMCLVEVAESRKALPACATPVTEGMKVFTQSERALAAQRGVMEFLLINHPLDCPICDQGGECELQDMSMGYGAGLGQYSEGKRVVKDKDIGPLINTDMTRCIHCTRCVRFGEEVAGIKELGATGRGEHMEIGTYIEQSVASELSGNIIDLCPVGALTSKPYRYKARAWELTAHDSIAPHDAVGSNIEFHTRRNEVLRVVPRENESLNETWLSDRDRFAYLGLNHAERATTPMIKTNGEWQETDWQTALQVAIDGLKTISNKHGEEQIAGAISPTATLEETYLFQKLLKGIDAECADYRLRQQDFADGDIIYNPDNWTLADIEESYDIVLVGCNIRAEQPIIAHRIRQSAMLGTPVTNINFFSSDLLIPNVTQVTVDINGMLNSLSGIAKALLLLAENEDSWSEILATVTPSAQEHTIAMRLANAKKATIFVGALASNHPEASKINALVELITSLSSTTMIVLPTANSTAAQIAKQVIAKGGVNSELVTLQQALQQQLRAYVLFGVEPELDCADPILTKTALQQASLVISMTSYVTEQVLAYSDVILPVSTYSETSGTFIGVDKQWQSFTGAVNPKGDARPGWKLLRVLGNMANLKGFDYVASTDVRDEVHDQLNLLSLPKNKFIPTDLSTDSGLMLISEIPMYQTDSVVRRSNALQVTIENKHASVVRMNESEAQKHGVSDYDKVEIQQGDNLVVMPLVLDNAIADNCVYLAAGTVKSSMLGAAFSSVTVHAVESGSA